MTEKELILRIKAAADAASFGKVKDHLGSLGGAAATAGKIMAVGLAAGAAAIGITAAVAFSAVRSAEALADAQARVGLVYGKAAAEVNAAAASNANALGMTKAAYLDSAGALGQYAVNLGVTQAKAAEYGTTLTELAPKIAAYTGAEQGAVSDALEKALGGKTKALEAMGYHIEKAPKGLSDAAAAQFYYSQVLDQSANAQKAWNDNAGDTDVSLARISSSFEDAKAKAGTLIAAAVAPWLKTVADYASELSAAFQTGGLDGLAAKFNELTGIDLSGWLAALQQKWADVTAAFQDGGVVGALSEIVGFDFQPLIDNIVATKDSFLAFWHDAVEPTAAFVLGTLVPAIVSVTGWFVKHKEVLVGAAAAYGAFKVAMGIQAVFANVSTAASLGAKAMVVWGNVMKLAGIQTSFFSTALKIAAGPIGWLILAVGLLAAAWAGNWGGIREKTAAVVDWIKTIPAQLAAGWTKLKADLLALVVAWSIKWAEVKQHPVKAFGEVLAFLATLPARMLKLGVDIVLGILGGLKAGWDKLMSWWRGKQADIPNAIVKHHDMQSPAKLEFRLGFWITQGLALGIAAGGILATQAMAKTLSDLDSAKAAVVGGQAIADAAKAAVAAALAADGVVQGKRESASEAWGRYYDEMTRRENELNDQILRGIEEQRKAAETKNAKNLQDLVDIIEKEKRHFEWLKDQQAQGDPRQQGPQLPDFSLEKDRVAKALAPILALIDPAYIGRGTKALADFWKKYNDDANANIITTEDLGKAIDAVMGALQKHYDKIGEDTTKLYDDLASAEDVRHKHALDLLLQRKALIDALIQAQTDAEADLSDLIAVRDALLAQARTAIANAQKGAEEFEDRVHSGIMAAIAQERDAQTVAHKGRMIQLEDEKRAIEAGHVRRLAQLQEQRDKITDGFDERQRQIDHERAALDQLKLDLGVEEAAAKLVSLKEQLNDLIKVAESFQIVARGKEANDRARHAVVDRVRVTTDEQRRALQAALASGTLDEKDRRRVELLLLGRGTQRLADVQRILLAGQDVLKGQIEYQQAVVNANDLAIKAREHLIEMAERQLKIDKDGAVERLADIDRRMAAEDALYARELSNINARITLEQQRFEDEMAFLDRISDAEGRRHDQRMTDISSEYALELAKLGMTQQQIDDLVAAAQREAARIAQETADALAKLREASRGGIGATPVPGMPGPGGEVPITPILPINPGGPPIGRLRPAGGGELTLDVQTVEASEATIESVDLEVHVDGTTVIVQIDGKDFAAQVVKTIAGDAVLLDALGKPLNERAARKATHGSTP